MTFSLSSSFPSLPASLGSPFPSSRMVVFHCLLVLEETREESKEEEKTTRFSEYCEVVAEGGKEAEIETTQKQKGGSLGCHHITQAFQDQGERN